MTDDPDKRLTPPSDGDELPTLLGFLEHHRATLAWKCSGLTSEQLRTPLHPTTMTLAGLLAHMGTVEDFWFSEVLRDSTFPLEHWPAEVDGNPEWEWTQGALLEADDLRARWSAACERSRAVAADIDDLTTMHDAWGGRARVSTRWVLTHMVEEYARHNGHADLLRQNVDGAVGD